MGRKKIYQSWIDDGKKSERVRVLMKNITLRLEYTNSEQFVVNLNDLVPHLPGLLSKIGSYITTRMN